MSNVFSLDSLREEVANEFAPLKIALSDGTETVLRNLLRLNEKTRTEILDTLKSLDLNDDDEDVKGDERVSQLIAGISRVLELVSDKGKKFVKELDGDLLLMMKILNTWMEESQLGEAQTSPNS